MPQRHSSRIGYPRKRSVADRCAIARSMSIASVGSRDTNSIRVINVIGPSSTNRRPNTSSAKLLEIKATPLKSTRIRRPGHICKRFVSFARTGRAPIRDPNEAVSSERTNSIRSLPSASYLFSIASTGSCSLPPNIRTRLGAPRSFNLTFASTSVPSKGMTSPRMCSPEPWSNVSELLPESMHNRPLDFSQIWKVPNNPFPWPTLLSRVTPSRIAWSRQSISVSPGRVVRRVFGMPSPASATTSSTMRSFAAS